jgi:ribosomal protein S27AE
MPTIVLKLTHAPTDTSDHQPSQSAGPLLRGTGDTDYVCGNCGFVIASGMRPNQRVPVDNTTCSACGAGNEFPPELRS